MNYDRHAPPYLNRVEQRLLGWLVRILLSDGNARLQRARAESGDEATARIACVNALRVYAFALFVLGCCLRLVSLTVLADVFYVLATLTIGWSLWALYTAYMAEREFKRAQDADRAGTVEGKPRLPKLVSAIFR